MHLHINVFTAYMYVQREPLMAPLLVKQNNLYLHAKTQTQIHQRLVSSHQSSYMENCLFLFQIEPHTIIKIQNLLNSNRKKTVECVIPTGSDPLPDEEILLSLKQACPDAAFFTLIPPIGEDSGEPTVPQKTQDYFPRTLTSFHSDENKNASDQELELMGVQRNKLTIYFREQKTKIVNCGMNIEKEE